jgi:hypothetical protein
MNKRLIYGQVNIEAQTHSQFYVGGSKGQPQVSPKIQSPKYSILFSVF